MKFALIFAAVIAVCFVSLILGLVALGQPPIAIGVLKAMGVALVLILAVYLVLSL